MAPKYQRLQRRSGFIVLFTSFSILVAFQLVLVTGCRDDDSDCTSEGDRKCSGKELLFCTKGEWGGPYWRHETDCNDVCVEIQTWPGQVAYAQCSLSENTDPKCAGVKDGETVCDADSIITCERDFAVEKEICPDKFPVCMHSEQAVVGEPTWCSTAPVSDSRCSQYVNRFCIDNSTIGECKNGILQTQSCKIHDEECFENSFYKGKAIDAACVWQ